MLTVGDHRLGGWEGGGTLRGFTGVCARVCACALEVKDVKAVNWMVMIDFPNPRLLGAMLLS